MSDETVDEKKRGDAVELAEDRLAWAEFVATGVALTQEQVRAYFSAKIQKRDREKRSLDRPIL